MTAGRWERVKELLHQALQLAPEQRAWFLDQACSSDKSLRAEVESLLLADENVRSSFLQTKQLTERRGAEAKTAGLRGSLGVTQPAPVLPAKFGPYEIVEPVGKGGMGEVYRARDTRLGRYVAVKILPADMCRDPHRLARFENEARAASALNHPNIVAVHDIGRESGIPFIVTEFIEGESLRSLIARGPVLVEKLLEIATQLAAGLRAAHAAGVLHRDLKPENMMLTPDMQVKILDFGLAKHQTQTPDTGARSGPLYVTAPGMVMGTIGYLSPEQVRGERADTRSDIFSLGVVLYELAAGKRPFVADTALNVMASILEDEPAALPANIPPALDRIILRCLEKDPELRFQNGVSLAEALKGIAKISPLRSVLRVFARPSRAWPAAAAITAGIVGASVWFVAHRPDRHPPAASQTQSASVQPAVTLPAPAPPQPKPADADPHNQPRGTAPAIPVPQPPKGAQPPTAQPPETEPNDGERGRHPAAKEAAPPSATEAPKAPQPALTPPATPEPQAIPEPKKTVPPSPYRNAVIETIAGRSWKFAGDGMPARQVALGHCDDIKCDDAGDIYATDFGNQAIVKIDRNGILHVLAGPDSPPEDRPRAPHFLAVDHLRAVYFSQTYQVRKLLPDGHIVPFAGRQAANGNFTPDGARAQGAGIAQVTGMVLAPDGSVIFSEFGNHRIRRVDAQGNLQTYAGNGKPGFAGDGGPAIRASLRGPRGLAVDRMGNLFIADSANGCVRRVGPRGQIATVAGHGIGGELGCPTGVALSGRGELFIADPCKGQVFMVRNGRLALVGGTGVIHSEPTGDGGPATAASFDLWGLSTDQQGNLLVSGPDFGHIYRISPDGRFSVIAGSGLWGVTRDGTPASQALFQQPFRLAVDSARNIFMTDLTANSIYRIDRRGVVTRIAGYPGLSHFGFEGEDTPAHYYRLNGPDGIRVRADGSVVFADQDNNRVREVTADHRLRTLAGDGRRSFGGDGGRAVDASLNAPHGVGVDAAGNIYIADTDNQRVRKFTPGGRIITVAGNGTAGYSGDGDAAERAELNNPTAVDVDSNGDLYIADRDNHRIRRVSGGVITTLAGDGRAEFSGDGGNAANARLNVPADLALGADHQLFILDRSNHRIRRIDLASGIITTLAGNGTGKTSGDGGPAAEAGLGSPSGIAADAAGNVYLTDAETRQLRIIRPGPR